MAKLVEVKLPIRVFCGWVEVAYSRNRNRAKIYDTSGITPIEVAEVWYGDAGWTYGGEVSPNWDSSFHSQNAAIKSAAYAYAGKQINAIQKQKQSQI